MRVSRQRLWPQARRVQPERRTVRSTTADVRDDAAAHRGRHTDHPARPRPVRQGGRPRRRGVWGRILGVAGFPGHHVRTESPLPRLLASVTEPRTAGVSQWYDRLTRAAALLCRMRPSRDRPGGGPGVGPTLLEPAPEVRRPIGWPTSPQYPPISSSRIAGSCWSSIACENASPTPLSVPSVSVVS